MVGLKPLVLPELGEAFAEAQMGLAEVDPQGRVVSCNALFATLLGHKKAKLVGHRFPDHIQSDDKDRLERILRRVAAGGIPAAGEVRLVFSDNTRRYLSHRILPWRDAGGHVERLVVLLQDETLRRQRRSELQTAREQLEGLVATRTSELEATVRELEAFNYSITHDLRTPLRSIRGFADLLLQQKDKLPREMRTHVEFIHEAAGRMGDTIDGLLRLARMSRGELRRQRVDLSEIVRRIVADLRRRSRERQVAVDIETDLIAQADPQMIEVLLQNLLENAWKFTRTKPKGRIEFGTTQIDDRTYFFVHDNGVGFDSRSAAELFQPFRRYHSQQEFEGSGLGLATARRVVRRHGGQIFAEATPGQGATFYFSLSRWATWG